MSFMDSSQLLTLPVLDLITSAGATSCSALLFLMNTTQLQISQMNSNRNIAQTMQKSIFISLTTSTLKLQSENRVTKTAYSTATKTLSGIFSNLQRSRQPIPQPTITMQLPMQTRLRVEDRGCRDTKMPRANSLNIARNYTHLALVSQVSGVQEHLAAISWAIGKIRQIASTTMGAMKLESMFVNRPNRQLMIYTALTDTRLIQTHLTKPLNKVKTGMNLILSGFLHFSTPVMNRARRIMPRRTVPAESEYPTLHAKPVGSQIEVQKLGINFSQLSLRLLAKVVYTDVEQRALNRKIICKKSRILRWLFITKQ